MWMVVGGGGGRGSCVLPSFPQAKSWCFARCVTRFMGLASSVKVFRAHALWFLLDTCCWGGRLVGWAALCVCEGRAGKQCRNRFCSLPPCRHLSALTPVGPPLVRLRVLAAFRYGRTEMMNLHSLTPLSDKLALIEGVTTRNCLYPALLDPIDPEEVRAEPFRPPPLSHHQSHAGWC